VQAGDGAHATLVERIALGGRIASCHRARPVDTRVWKEQKEFGRRFGATDLDRDSPPTGGGKLGRGQERAVGPWFRI
jgi:hypothetical protein